MDREHNSDELANEISSITLLIDRAKGGCVVSRERVFQQLQDFLESTANRHKQGGFGSKQGLSDIVQQSFVQAIQNFSSFRGTSGNELRGWLKQLVINEIRQAHRAQTRLRRDVSRERPLDGGANASDLQLTSGDLTPGTQVIQEELVIRMRLAIEQLPEDYRRVIQLRNFDQKSYDEIATEMDRSAEAVTKLWFRAVMKLKKMMAGDDERSAT